MKLAYIAEGKLFVTEEGSNSQPIESTFAQEFIQRSIQIARKNEWKSKGREGMWRDMNLWNVGASDDPNAIKIQFMDATPGHQPGELLYCMQTDRVGGLFSQTLDDGRELRLIHNNKFLLHQIRNHPQEPVLIGSLDNPNGTANLVLIQGENHHMREVTDGDSRDQNPSWIPGRDRSIVYQSAGVARNQEGYTIGYGPAAIMRLNLTEGHLEPLQENQSFDFMQPKYSVEGNLFYIRRPYQLYPWKQNDPVKWLSDIALFPFRLTRAVLDYLNVFSMMYSRKPLKTAGGPARPEEDMASIILQGRRLAVQEELREFSADGAPALVPPDWELVRQKPDGTVSVLSRGVVAFDLGTSGGIAYTNGTGIFAMDEDGSNRRRLGRAWMVERISTL